MLLVVTTDVFYWFGLGSGRPNLKAFPVIREFKITADPTRTTLTNGFSSNSLLKLGQYETRNAKVVSLGKQLQGTISALQVKILNLY